MSENQPSQIASDSVNSSAQDSSTDEWTQAAIPGTVHTANPSANGDVKPIDATRETELLTLIHDLNDCNDVLLSKVSQLEAELDSARQNAQEKARSAQQTSQTAQQQVASVVAQLETAEQGSQRQQLINETLLAELTNAQERVRHLEHECAMNAQRHAEEAQARVKAESTIRDLRSRLQRQQRYTLQFKAALEKSLTVTTRPATARSSESDHHPAPFSAFQDTDSNSAVPMPKAQRIMPWAGAVAASPFAGIDPHLENLIRGAGKASRDVAIRDRAEDANTPVTNSDTENKLWQDVEQAVDHTANESHSDESLSKETLPEEPNFAEDRTTENKLVESKPIEHESVESADAQKAASPAQAETTTRPELKSIVIDPYTVPAGQAPAKEVALTEPSPWGKPLAEKITAVAEAAAESATESRAKKKTERPADGNYPPLADLEDSAVSPVVNPLRPQRKIGSMSAVQLPTFEQAKAASFKR